MDGQAHFLQLFLKHQTELKAFIRSLVPRAADADDILQETALVCWQKFDEFDDSRSFGAWARGVASKKILQHRGQDRRRPTPFSPEAIDAVLEVFNGRPLESSPQAEALEQCVGALEDHARRLLKLRYGDDLGVAEIANRSEMQPEAAQKALFRIRKRLQDCVERKLGAVQARLKRREV